MSFFFSAAHRYLGVIYAKAPPDVARRGEYVALGVDLALVRGDLAEARRRADAALKVDPKSPAYWLVHVAVRDRELRRREIAFDVVHADPAAWRPSDPRPFLDPDRR